MKRRQRPCPGRRGGVAPSVDIPREDRLPPDSTTSATASPKQRTSAGAPDSSFSEAARRSRTRTPAHSSTDRGHIRLMQQLCEKYLVSQNREQIDSESLTSCPWRPPCHRRHPRRPTCPCRRRRSWRPPPRRSRSPGFWRPTWLLKEALLRRTADTHPLRMICSGPIKNMISRANGHCASSLGLDTKLSVIVRHTNRFILQLILSAQRV